MKLSTLLLCLCLFSGTVLSKEILVENSDCILRITENTVEDFIHFKADFKTLGVVSISVPGKFWPPVEGKRYKWVSRNCSYCKSGMTYKNKVLNIYRNRQRINRESESLSIYTDLIFEKPVSMKLSEGILFIPFMRHKCSF